ncbi:tumor necrosis factor ligand superfamily member 10 isoform X3 [Protopterus annectens]|uniref:tumor necrosis factor ligand superfamily member 10 isoform X3 n=1 Tax=Protopterus annectens TaxID=7888 RepID=UPI001CFB23F8|nr:tumor necrosis factor ligand superfamily member 10 isoform X3 [Protopterus annectens]
MIPPPVQSEMTRRRIQRNYLELEKDVPGAYISLLKCYVEVRITALIQSIHLQWQDTLSRHSIACLTGETLGSYIGALKAGKDRSVDLEEDPCGQVRLHLQYLTEKIMTEHYGKQLDAAVKGEVSRILPYLSTEVQTPSLSLPQTRIAAHVTGSQTKEEGNVEKNKKMKMFGQKIETWEKDRGLAFLQNIELKNGALK